MLSGRIVRGNTDRLDAVIWFSDLRGFTRITDTAPEQVIPLLNSYSDAIVSAVHEHGGDVLKLIGDGTLAIFTAEDRAHACGAALSAAIDARRGIAELNTQRLMRGKRASVAVPHCEFSTPGDIDKEVRAAGFSAAEHRGVLFGPMRILYKLSTRLASKLAPALEPIDDALCSGTFRQAVDHRLPALIQIQHTVAARKSHLVERRACVEPAQVARIGAYPENGT